MNFDVKNWTFPVENLIGKRLYLCVSEVGFIFKKKKITGGRLECVPIKLPTINSGYEDDVLEEPEILLDFLLPTLNLIRLAGQKFSRKKLRVDESKESVYLFDVHNSVELLELEFNSVTGNIINTKLRIRFDFDSKSRIGGVFEHEFAVQAMIEER